MRRRPAPLRRPADTAWWTLSALHRSHHHSAVSAGSAPCRLLRPASSPEGSAKSHPPAPAALPTPRGGRSAIRRSYQHSAVSTDSAPRLVREVTLTVPARGLTVGGDEDVEHGCRQNRPPRRHCVVRHMPRVASILRPPSTAIVQWVQPAGIGRYCRQPLCSGCNRPEKLLRGAPEPTVAMERVVTAVQIAAEARTMVA